MKCEAIRVSLGQKITFDPNIIYHRSSALIPRNIRVLYHQALVCRTDDLIHAHKLLHPMCTPADDSGNRKQRGVQLYRYSEHIIDKSAVKVHIRADALIHLALLGNEHRCNPLDLLI